IPQCAASSRDHHLERSVAQHADRPFIERVHAIFKPLTQHFRYWARSGGNDVRSNVGKWGTTGLFVLALSSSLFAQVGHSVAERRAQRQGIGVLSAHSIERWNVRCRLAHKKSCRVQTMLLKPAAFFRNASIGQHDLSNVADMRRREFNCSESRRAWPQE